MPNVRHEESLEGIVIPEIIQDPPGPQRTEEEDLSQKGDGHACKNQYREDFHKQV
jgi:hypothetical protein